MIILFVMSLSLNSVPKWWAKSLIFISPYFIAASKLCFFLQLVQVENGEKLLQTIILFVALCFDADIRFVLQRYGNSLMFPVLLSLLLRVAVIRRAATVPEEHRRFYADALNYMWDRMTVLAEWAIMKYLRSMGLVHYAQDTGKFTNTFVFVTIYI